MVTGGREVQRSDILKRRPKYVLTTTTTTESSVRAVVEHSCLYESLSVLTFSHFQTQTEDKGCVLQENKSNKMSTFRDRKTQLKNMSKFTVNC